MVGGGCWSLAGPGGGSKCAKSPGDTIRETEEKERDRQTCRLPTSQEQRETPEQRKKGLGSLCYFLRGVLELPVTVPCRRSVNPVE